MSDFMSNLRAGAKRAMESKIGRFIRRADGGAVPAAKGRFAAGGMVGGPPDVGGVDGAAAPRNLGKAARGRPKGKAGKGKGKKGGSKTNVNVVVMPKEKDAAAAAPAAGMPSLPPVPPIPPPAPPAGGAPMPMPPPPMPAPDAAPPLGGAAGPTPGGPPIMDPMAGAPIPLRKAGGRVPMDAGAGSGEGRLAKADEYGSRPGKAVSA